MARERSGRIVVRHVNAERDVTGGCLPTESDFRPSVKTA